MSGVHTGTDISQRTPGKATDGGVTSSAKLIATLSIKEVQKHAEKNGLTTVPPTVQIQNSVGYLDIYTHQKRKDSAA